MLLTHRPATLALDVPQINWRMTAAHLPTEDKPLGSRLKLTDIVDTVPRSN